MSTKYVHEGKEVILTGRVAKKQLRSGKEQVLFEIQIDGAMSKQHNKWVAKKDLFEICDEQVTGEEDVTGNQ